MATDLERPPPAQLGLASSLTAVLFPKSLARFNRGVTNKVMGPIAKMAPFLAVIHHTSRRSGSEYTTPVNAFRYRDGYIIALTYGRDTDWVKNVRTAGGCRLETKGRIMEMRNPRFIPTAEGLRAMPSLVHLALAKLEVEDFLTLRTEEPA